MRIAILNVSEDPRLSLPELVRTVSACARQVSEHYTTMWQGGDVPVRLVLDARDIKPDDFPIAIQKTPDAPLALGYHALGYGRVFTDPIYANGGTSTDGPNSVSATLSHEILETVGDPYVAWWHQRETGELEAIELCDRVEGDAYAIDDVSVSNFLGPHAFRPTGARAPFDWMRLLTSPLEIRPGGYAILWTPGQEARSVFASGFPRWKYDYKRREGARSAQRLARGTIAEAT